MYIRAGEGVYHDGINIRVYMFHLELGERATGPVV